jgi:hypothetical protein
MDGPADLDLMVEELNTLRRRIRELEDRAGPLVVALIAAMTRAGLCSFTTSTGSTASLIAGEAGQTVELT